MTARCAMVGHIAPRSQPARMTVRGAVVEPTRTPIVAQLVEVANEAVQDDTTPTTQANPLFTWSDETIGGQRDSGGKLRWNWSQSEQDWIRTGC